MADAPLADPRAPLGFADPLTAIAGVLGAALALALLRSRAVDAEGAKAVARVLAADADMAFAAAVSAAPTAFLGGDAKAARAQLRESSD